SKNTVRGRRKRSSTKKSANTSAKKKPTGSGGSSRLSSSESCGFDKLANGFGIHGICSEGVLLQRGSDDDCIGDFHDVADSFNVHAAARDNGCGTGRSLG